jgi:hypothetical protein
MRCTLQRCCASFTIFAKHIVTERMMAGKMWANMGNVSALKTRNLKEPRRYARVDRVTGQSSINQVPGELFWTINPC